jgi:serine/threonine protein kinase
MGYYYLVTELFDGVDLLDRIKQEETFNERFIANIIFEILNAIAACHERMICHRDLKLDNVLIDKNNNIKVIDFGAAEIVEPDKGIKGMAGTIYYLAPEVADNKRFYNEKCDMWSIGVIMYCLITKKFPFHHKNDEVTKLIIKKG